MKFNFTPPNLISQVKTPMTGAFSLMGRQLSTKEIAKAIGTHETNILYDKSNRPYVPKSESEKYSYDNGIALGKYQVEYPTLRDQSRKLYGREITPEEFLSNPELQDEFIIKVLNSWKEQYPELTSDDLIKSWNQGLNIKNPKEAEKYLSNVAKYLETKTGESGLLTQFDIGRVGAESAGFEQVVGKPGINPVVVAREILQGIMRSGGAVGLTITGKPEMQFPEGTIEQRVKNILFGEEAVKSLATRIAGGEQVGQRLGLGMFSLPAAFLATGAIVGIDFTGVGGAKKAGELLLKETSEEAIGKILTKLKIGEDLLPKWSKYFAKANTPKKVSRGLELLSKEISEISKKAISKLPESIPTQVPVKLPQVGQEPLERIIPQVSEELPLTTKIPSRVEKSIGEEITGAIDKLSTAIKTAAKPARKELEKLYTAERAKRTGAIGGIFERGEGQEGYLKALGKLRGGLVSEEKKLFELKRQKLPTIKPITLRPTSKITELKTQIEGLESVLDSSPASQLSKYAGPNKELPEVVGYGKSEYARRGDQIVTELGFADDTEAHYVYGRFLRGKKQLSELKQELRATQKESFTDYTQEQLDKINHLLQEASQNIEGILGKTLAEGDINLLFKAAQINPQLNVYDKLNTQTALVKVLQGVIPTNSELALLEKTYGSRIVDAILSQRTLGQKVLAGLGQIANLPRTVMASFDLSAPLRQGLMLISHPKRFGQAFMSMFKQFGSENAFKAVQESIERMPEYALMKEGKLALTDTGRFLTGREEAFMSSWAEKIPVVGKMIRASNRAYTGFLNKLRADVFSDIIRGVKSGGRELDDKLVKEIAGFVNNASGRGDKLFGFVPIGKSGPLLNGLFFSPKLMASRTTLLNPIYYITADPVVRKEALKSLFTVLGSGMTMLGLAKAAGAKTGDDWRSADVGKIIIGNTRIDIWGGFQQYIRMAGQLITGEYVSTITGKITTLGEGYKPLTRLGILGRQIESKTAPVLSFIIDILRQQDYRGEPVKITNEVLQRFIPMVVGDIYDIAKDNPELLPMSLLGVFGVGLQTYEPAKKKKLRFKFY